MFEKSTFQKRLVTSLAFFHVLAQFLHFDFAQLFKKRFGFFFSLSPLSSSFFVGYSGLKCGFFIITQTSLLTIQYCLMEKIFQCVCEEPGWQWFAAECETQGIFSGDIMAFKTPAWCSWQHDAFAFFFTEIALVTSKPEKVAPSRQDIFQGMSGSAPKVLGGLPQVMREQWMSLSLSVCHLLFLSAQNNWQPFQSLRAWVRYSSLRNQCSSQKQKQSILFVVLNTCSQSTSFSR